MCYKYTTPGNVGEIGFCVEEARLSRIHMIPIFVVGSKELADQIIAMAAKSEELEWAVLIVPM